MIQPKNLQELPILKRHTMPKGPRDSLEDYRTVDGEVLGDG